MHNNVPPIILTTGEPAGIGIDLCVFLVDYLLQKNIVLCGDIRLLQQRAKYHAKNIRFYKYESGQQLEKGALAVLHIDCPEEVIVTKLNNKNSGYVLNMLEQAVKRTELGQFSAIVTAPIHKGIICDVEDNFTGHTEFFAKMLGVEKPVMMLANNSLKVALMTTHLPLKDVSLAIDKELINNILNVVNNDLKTYFNITSPKIAVCGLNPHAGEGGYLGSEEIDIINPAIENLRQQGLDITDCLPADTIFTKENSNKYDIIIAMYHDQGLPVIKSNSFGECVNITLGLPIIRTSVDHGTALELAGTKQANPNSLKCAIEYAERMSKNNEK